MLKFALMKVEKSGAWDDSILSIAFKQVHLPKNVEGCLRGQSPGSKVTGMRAACM
jgi:hypothetical protein